MSYFAPREEQQCSYIQIDTKSKSNSVKLTVRVLRPMILQASRGLFSSISLTLPSRVHICTDCLSDLSGDPMVLVPLKC